MAKKKDGLEEESSNMQDAEASFASGKPIPFRGLRAEKVFKKSFLDKFSDSLYKPDVFAIVIDNLDPSKKMMSELVMFAFPANPNIESRVLLGEKTDRDKVKDLLKSLGAKVEEGGDEL